MKAQFSANRLLDYGSSSIFAYRGKIACFSEFLIHSVNRFCVRSLILGRLSEVFPFNHGYFYCTLFDQILPFHSRSSFKCRWVHNFERWPIIDKFVTLSFVTLLRTCSAPQFWSLPTMRLIKLHKIFCISSLVKLKIASVYHLFTAIIVRKAVQSLLFRTIGRWKDLGSLKRGQFLKKITLGWG